MQHTVTALILSIKNQIKSEFNDPVLIEQTAWWLLEALTNKNKLQLIAQQSVELSIEKQQQLDAWLFQLTQLHKPLQYILGWVPFAGLDIKVEPPILIPRPETEEWMLWLINQLEPLKQRKLYILDIGTGTGCIALSLAHALPNAYVTALDIDPQALALARTNAQRNGVENCEFVESDVFDGIPRTQRFDLIVSNPPYIAREEQATLDASVQTWESHQALFEGHHGLAVIERIIKQAPEHLSPTSSLQDHNIARLMIEIGYKQGQEVKELMLTHGFKNVEIVQDLEGKDRIVCGSY